MGLRLLFFEGSTHLRNEFGEVCTHGHCFVCFQTNTWQRHHGPNRIGSGIKGQELPAPIAANRKEPGSIFGNLILESKLDHILCFPKLKPSRLDPELTLAAVRVPQEGQIILWQRASYFRGKFRHDGLFRWRFAVPIGGRVTDEVGNCHNGLLSLKWLDFREKSDSAPARLANRARDSRLSRMHRASTRSRGGRNSGRGCRWRKR